MRIHIGQGDKIVLGKMRKWVGGLGKVYRLKKPVTDNDRSSKMWQWIISSVQAEKLLIMLIPYLMVKRPEALLALEFRKHKKLYFRFTHNDSGSVWDTTLSKLELYNHNKFRRLNYWRKK